MSTHDPMVSVVDIKQNLNLILEFTQDMSFEIFRNNIQCQYATIRCFEIIGEAAKRIPESFRLLHPDFPWRSMAAMRDKLIHGYDIVDSSVVWGTIKTDVPSALTKITVILETETS